MTAPGDEVGYRPRTGMARVDDAVDDWCARHRSTGADRLFYSLSSAFDHGLGWLALAALRAARDRDERPLVRFSLVLGVESFATNVVVKSFFRRRRPIEHDTDFDRAEVDLPYGLHMPITSSFPSGHAAAAFTAAAALSRGPGSLVGYHALAALIAASRVYVRLHHTSDVVAGVALGTMMGVTARKVFPVDG